MNDPKRSEPSKSMEAAVEEAPPVLKSWKNLYLLVLGNLIFWILLLTLFTLIFK